MILREIKLWWYREFCVITLQKAKNMNLVYHRDAIKVEREGLDCNYFYKDIKNRIYRVI